ncbi:MAG: hypothetical protein KC502_10990 [Myxococcales bacterium]|nr:hypothetical protein [Myxococcales bacterium]
MSVSPLAARSALALSLFCGGLVGCGSTSPNTFSTVSDASGDAASSSDAGPVDAGAADSSAPKDVSAQPTCGDGVVKGGEDCDKAAWTQKSCSTMGFAGGWLGCADDCSFDTADCLGQQGKDVGFGQPCGDEFGDCGAGLTCVIFSESQKSRGYCTAKCSDTLACPGSPAGASCAYELKDGSNICGFLCSDGQPTCPKGLTCTAPASGGGNYCANDPKPVCGNGEREFGEVCDGADLDGLSCAAFGHESGQLQCDKACTFDHSKCSGEFRCLTLPKRDCTAGTACAKVEPFTPVKTADYIVTHGSKKSWLRRDTRMLVQYAAANVRCVLPGSWPLGLGDMSEPDGGTPKAPSGKLRHPSGTHTYGRDLDIAYYQTGTSNNYLRPVCPSTINGKNANHCVGAPTILDAERSALFIMSLLTSSRVRVIGVDGKIGPVLQKAIATLQSKKLISKSAVKRFASKVAWEEVNEKLGWYYFHHHHLHLSTYTTPYSADAPPPPALSADFMHARPTLVPNPLARRLPLARIYKSPR